MADDIRNTESTEPSGAERMFGDFAPALVHFTDDVLFGEVWKRPDLSAKERSLVTVAALTALGNTDRLLVPLQLAPPPRPAPPPPAPRAALFSPPPPPRRNGNSDEELIEAVTHLAFYTGWPKA